MGAGALAESTPASADTYCDQAGPSPGGTCGTICDHFCDVVMAGCTSDRVVYADRPACLEACATWDDTGEPTRASGDTAQCRNYHATVALAGDDASRRLHCPHAGVESAVCN